MARGGRWPTCRPARSPSSTPTSRAAPPCWERAARRRCGRRSRATTPCCARPIAAHDGHVFRTAGDGLCAAFAAAPDAVAAALAAQRALHAEPWGEVGPLRVRMALHTGEAELRDGDYVGAASTGSRGCWRPATAGRCCSRQATAELVRDALPAGAGLRDLGEHRLRDLAQPERVFQLLHADLPADFPPLRSLDAYPHNLPLQLTSFVGREREMAEVAAAAGDDAAGDADRRRRLRQDPPGAPGGRRRWSTTTPTASGWSSWRRWPTRTLVAAGGRRARSACASSPASRS